MSGPTSMHCRGGKLCVNLLGTSRVRHRAGVRLGQSENTESELYPFIKMPWLERPDYFDLNTCTVQVHADAHMTGVVSVLNLIE